MNRDSRRSRFLLAAATLAVVLLVASPAQTHQFEQGAFSLGIGGSLQFAPDQTIFVVSAGLGYFILDGLELGLASAAFFGARPFVTQVTPGVRYIFWMVPVVHPYLGAFYRHWFIASGTPDLDTAGGRAGVIIVPTPAPIFVGVGVVYERVLNPCDAECSRFYPELTFSISF